MLICAKIKNNFIPLPKHLEIQQPSFKIVLWHITEPLSFFENKMTNWGDDYAHIKAENRKLQYAASRYATSLLTFDTDASQIKKDEYRRPFLQNPNQHISISHDGNWAASAIGNEKIGVDVFCIQDKVLKIAHKFLSPHEQEILATKINSTQDKTIYYSILWSIKESVFKWMRLQNIEFITEIIITELNENHALINTKKHGVISVNYIIENNICLSWVTK
ncbi:MAG: hypothetical protein RL708_1901 [Bacteroidota bacterium]|jgi:4'-phosphopantetheinyl transferase EntD